MPQRGVPRTAHPWLRARRLPQAVPMAYFGVGTPSRAWPATTRSMVRADSTYASDSVGHGERYRGQPAILVRTPVPSCAYRAATRANPVTSVIGRPPRRAGLTPHVSRCPTTRLASPAQRIEHAAAMPLRAAPHVRRQLVGKRCGDRPARRAGEALTAHVPSGAYGPVDPNSPTTNACSSVMLSNTRCASSRSSAG